MSKVILIILDGVGYKKNSYVQKNLPFVFSKNYKLLNASGRAVGLPKGYMGNSEVGHLTIGAGRVEKQMLLRINEAIKDKSFFKKLKDFNGKVHLIGLWSEAGVHSHLKHLKELIKKYPNAYLHVITDGRDTSPKEVKKYLKKISNKNIATISGRYYAMDRDKRWNRTKLYFDCLKGNARKFESVSKAINFAYKNNETDEFIKPTIIDNFKGILKDDLIIFFNFREDRMRQIVKLVGKQYRNVLCMSNYDNSFNYPVLFEKKIINNTLGEIVSKLGKKQLRIAETEKYAHITYFFNGGKEKQFKNEDRIIVPSPKVATYDKKPEMSAIKIKNKIIESLGEYDLIIANFANGDMVGHTGDIKATKIALNVINNCLMEIFNKANDYKIIITADHGNCEEMEGKFKKSHTINKVPILVLGENVKLRGGLENIAPTVLKLMKIKIPKIMSKSLV